ncbi:hypothetical protein [Luteibacter sp.]|uniref:hypothetical protein n=1 Tax=Luteibacter sp. TaxID=1886636 RepID=UPI0025BDD767|nr:hypothetical protein [Luteibacter sp.]
MTSHQEAHERRLTAMSNIECSIMAVLQGDGFQITSLTVPTIVWDRLVNPGSAVKSVQILGVDVTEDPTLPVPHWCRA